MKNKGFFVFFFILVAFVTAFISTRVQSIDIPTRTLAAVITDETRASVTCSDIEAQIDALEAVESWAQSRYEAHADGSDYWACQYASGTYGDVCGARMQAEYLNRYLCDSMDLSSPCRITSCRSIEH